MQVRLDNGKHRHRRQRVWEIDQRRTRGRMGEIEGSNGRRGGRTRAIDLLNKRLARGGIC
jgi:hypothetical protein